MNTGNLAFRSQMGRESVKTIGRTIFGQQKAGGLAALYLALAYLLAMPFFLLVVDYQSAVGPAAKVASLASNHGAMQSCTSSATWSSESPCPSLRWPCTSA